MKNKEKVSQKSVPRSMEDIQKNYTQLCTEAGQLQYQLKVYSQKLEEINSTLSSVNIEASARQQLDAQKLATEQAGA